MPRIALLAITCSRRATTLPAIRLWRFRDTLLLLLQGSSSGAGMAADELQRAEEYASAALREASHKSEAGLKLMGDIKLARHAAGPSLKRCMQQQDPTAASEALLTGCVPPSTSLGRPSSARCRNGVSALHDLKA